jgi:hypothetical protein
MKKRVNAIVIGLALSLTTVSVSRAMSELVSLSIEPEWPATPTPGNVVLYRVNAVVRSGSGMLEVSLSSLGLPAGAKVEFSPNLLRFTGHEPNTATAIMTVTCAELTATDAYPFTLTGTALRQTITLTNQVQQQKWVAERPALAIDRMSDGSLRLRGTGLAGQTYKIQATTSLTNPEWIAVGSSTADGNGRFTFFPGREFIAPIQFYRAVEVAPAR